MANSYVLYTANGSTTQFSLVGIDGWINNGFLKVYLNDVLQTTGYSLIDLSTPTPKVQFSSAPANNTIVRLQRETPATVSTFKSNIVDFNDGSILTAADLDKVVEGLLHITQEAEDTGSGAIGKTVDETNWDADSKRITNMDPGIDDNDAVTFEQLQTAALYGGAVTVPQVWAMTGTGGATYALSPAPLNTTEEMFIVEVGGVIQDPSTYTITSSAIVFDANVGSGLSISVRNFGVSRNIVESVTTAMLDDDAVTTAKINALAVTDAKLASNAVTTAKVANDAITYAKIQNVSATDRILGRATAGAGDVEEITCTAAGRALLDDLDAAAQRATLSLGNLALVNEVANANVATTANIALSKLQTIDALSIVGNNNASASATPIAMNTPTARNVLGIAYSAPTAISANTTVDLVTLAVGEERMYVVTGNNITLTFSCSSATVRAAWNGIRRTSTTAALVGAAIGTTLILSTNGAMSAAGTAANSATGADAFCVVRRYA